MASLRDGVYISSILLADVNGERPNGGEKKRLAVEPDESKETNRRKEFVRGREGWESSSRGNVASLRLVACFLVRGSIFFCVVSLSLSLVWIIICRAASDENDFIYQRFDLRFAGVRESIAVAN